MQAMPTLHPAFLLRQPGAKKRAWADLLTLTERPPAEAAQISFIAALAVADLVQGWIDPALVRLKWPNDVLIEGRKISGILVESGRRDDGRVAPHGWVVFTP